MVALGIGAVLGGIAFVRTRDLESKLNKVEGELRHVRRMQASIVEAGEAGATSNSRETSAPQETTEQKTEYSFDLDLDPALSEETPQWSAGSKGDSASTEDETHPILAHASEVSAFVDGTDSVDGKAVVQPVSSFWDKLQDSWMIWLGGGCVGLAGVFLVKYSVEQGLLGPGARIIAGLILGLMLHAGAEWFRRRLGSHPSFAALAGGGSITLFATLLSALQMYQLISPGFAFALMALVALLTLGLALLHGPVLAALGMLGAYAVPILVSTGSGNAVSALVYSLIISAATLVLMRQVFRPWLWYGLLVGALGWWLITLGAEQADGVRGLYLAILAYFIVVVSGRDGLYDWLISQTQSIDGIKWRVQPAEQRPLEALVLPSLGLIIVVQALSILLSGFDTSVLGLLLQWSPLTVVVLLAMRQREHLAPLPWLLFGMQLLAWLGSRIELSHAADAIDHQLIIAPITGELASRAFVYLGITASLFSGLSLWALTRLDFRWRQLSLSLATMAPLLSLGLAYSLSEQWTISWQWSLCSILLGTVYLSWAAKILSSNDRDPSAVWLLLSGHMAYALATAMVLREASLTLALAMLVVSLSWIIHRFKMPGLGWLLKAIVALVIMRLSLNPWLASYPVDVHWSLWSYGGAALCCGLGAWLLARLQHTSDGFDDVTGDAMASLSRWVGAAAMHLFVLFIWTETRYWLYDGDVFSARYDFLEASVNATFFGALALVYYHRASVSDQLRHIYHLGSYVLAAMALTNYLIILFSTLIAADWAVESVGSTKIFNLMLLSYAMPVVIAAMMYRWFDPRVRKTAAVVSSIGAFIFISLQIRHLWQGSIDLGLSTSNGELYTYSVVWLLLAIVATLGSHWFFSPVSNAAKQTYRAGMTLLAIVILKLFLIDLSDLEGLLRVASFMGLGLALLGIAYLHKRLTVDQVA